MLKNLKKILKPQTRTDSPIEEILLEAFEKFGLSPRIQYEVFPFYLDLAFPEIRLGIEADGAKYHSTKQQKSRDKYREGRLSSLGWRFERFPGTFIHRHADVIVAKIATKYFGDQITDKQRKIASGTIATFLLRGDPDLSVRIVEDYLEKHET